MAVFVTFKNRDGLDGGGKGGMKTEPADLSCLTGYDLENFRQVS